MKLIYATYGLYYWISSFNASINKLVKLNDIF
jgi:hypothetical protein